MQRFGKVGVTLERNGEEGTLTVPRASWARLPWAHIVFGLGFVLFVGAAACLYVAPDKALMLGLGGTMAVLFAVVFDSRRHLRDGVFHDLSKLEVVRREAKAGAGYRDASTPSSLVIRLPHREVPFGSVRQVVHTTNLVQPKDSSSYWVYHVFLVLADEVLDVCAFREDEKSRDRLVEALKEWFGVTAKRAESDPTGAKAPMMVAIFLAMFVLQIPTMFLVGINDVFATALPLPVRAGVLVALPLLVRFLLIPAAVGLFRPGVAKELRSKFKVQLDIPKPPRVLLGVSAVLLAVGFGAGGVAVSKSSAAKEAAEDGEADAEAKAIRGWAWGHDGIPVVVDPEGDGVADYVGAFEVKDNRDVVALFDGETHEVRWRTPPIVKVETFTVSGARVVVAPQHAPPFTLDLATGQDRVEFPADEPWARLAPHRMCPTPDGKVYVRGTRELWQLDLETTSVEVLEEDEDDPRCAGRVARGRGSTMVWREGVSSNVTVGDYQLMMSAPPQIHRNGKVIKRLASFTDVQDGPMCGNEDEVSVWIPVAAGGGVLLDLEQGTFGPAPRPSWCEERAVPDDGPVLPEAKVEGIELDTHGMLAGDTVYVSGTKDDRRWVLAFGDEGRTLSWKLELPGEPGRVNADVDGERMAVRDSRGNTATITVIDVTEPKVLYQHTVRGAGQLHGLAVTKVGILWSHGKMLTIFDRDEDRVVAQHPEKL